MSDHIANRRFTLQWHLTDDCQLSCSHCYVTSNSQKQTASGLGLEAIRNIISDVSRILCAWGKRLRINFTGGDPLLFPNLFEVLEYAHRADVQIGLLGNPDLLNINLCKELKRLGVSTYQLSIDGTESTHDKIRRQGSFGKTIDAIELLNQASITSVVMFTVSKMNYEELPVIVRLAPKLGVKRFSFSRLVPIGRGKKMGEDQITPNEYRELLLQVSNIYDELESKECQTHFGRKDVLWKLLYSELGRFVPKSPLIAGGCGVGYSSVCVMPDATVYPCRRLPVPIGNLARETFKQIFIESGTLNAMRNTENIRKCNTCSLINNCRGCRAVAYAVNGGYNDPDPQCWR